MFYVCHGGYEMLRIVYVEELPKNTIIKTKTIILVGIGQKGDPKDERICSQEREQVELHC